MLSINSNKYNPTFSARRVRSSYDFDYIENYAKNTPITSSANAATAYGKVLVTQRTKEEDDYLNLLERISQTPNDEVISIEDAITEFENVDITDKKKVDCIMAATFETDKTDVVINKKALLLLKESGGKSTQMQDVIRTALDEDTLSFNQSTYDRMFTSMGTIRRTACLKPRPQNTQRALREAKMNRKMQILNVLENNKNKGIQPASDFVVSDLFIPLDEKRNSLLQDLNNIENIPDDLRKSMNNAINSNNFDLKKVYREYYSLLNECNTLDEVKEFYPELEYPEKPVYTDKGYTTDTQKTLEYRLSKEENYDKFVIDVFKKGHTELRDQSDIYINLENSSPTKLRSLKNAGYNFTMPSPEMYALLEKSEKVASKYLALPKYDEKEIKDIASKHAVRESNVWADYAGMTAKQWLPVRLIKNKRMQPETSEYSTDKLVNAYLYNLYKQDKEMEYPKNPLEKHDEKPYLTRKMRTDVNSIYWTRYNRLDTEISEPDFVDFAAKFDKKAIGNSIEKMEKNYTNAFFSKYWTEDRLNKLKGCLQNAYDMIYEKIVLKEQIEPKVVDNSEVKELINNDFEPHTATRIDNERLAKFKYNIENIKDADLKERFSSCISDPDLVDLEYFDSMYNILENSHNESSLDEDKLFVLVTLHDKYLNQVLHSTDEYFEEDFINNELKSYKTVNGIDYKAFRNEFEAESKYNYSAEKMMLDGDFNILSLIENKFISNKNNDFNSANNVIEMYQSIPEIFKDKFVSTFENMSKVNTGILLKELGNMHEQISSWNYDDYDEIIMDADKIPQKVIILPEAKAQLFKATGGNMELFDTYLKKYKQAATRRTGARGGQGIKELKYENDDAEIKIKGDLGGGFRMFAREATEEDKKKYTTNDGIGVKYIFYKHDDHL